LAGLSKPSCSNHPQIYSLDIPGIHHKSKTNDFEQ